MESFRALLARLLICAVVCLALISPAGSGSMSLLGAGKPSGGGGGGSAADLNFAANTSTGCGAFTSCLTNTNSTGGYVADSTGLLHSIAANTLRIGSGTGLLIEAVGTNFLTQTQVPNGTDWGANSVTVSLNSTTAPDGTTTASTVVSTGSSASAINQNVDLATIGTYTFSAYIKQLTTNCVYFQINTYVGSPGSPNAAIAQYYNVATGAAGSTQTLISGLTSISTTVTPSASGFFRLTLTLTMPGGTTGVSYIPGPCDVDGDRTSANGASFYNWGNQIENAPFASSYIVNAGGSGTTANRDLDNVAISGILATTLGGSTGTIVANTSSSQQSIAATLVDANGVVLLGKTSGNLGTTAVGAALSTGNTGTWTGSNDLGLAWNASGGAIQLNAGTIVTDATARTPASTFHLGSTSGSSAFFNGYFSRLTAYATKQASPQ